MVRLWYENQGDFFKLAWENAMDEAEVIEKRKVLKSLILRWIGDAGRFETSIEGLFFVQVCSDNRLISTCYVPSLCLIVQGAKRLMVGGASIEYDENHYLVSSRDVPVIAQPFGMTEDHPYLALVFQFDLNLLSRFMAEIPVETSDQVMAEPLMVTPVEADLLDAFIRLIKLMDSPKDIPFLKPLILHEIYYRLLSGPQGMQLRKLTVNSGVQDQIRRTVNWLQENYRQSIPVSKLASMAGMSSSTFNQHFRKLTAMTPIQFQKRLRLIEARRLMLTENLDANHAAYVVGYESASQFSREYHRYFGAPPKRDISQIKQPLLGN